jgi:hypothetical protein
LRRINSRELECRCCRQNDARRGASRSSRSPARSLVVDAVARIA